MNAGNNGCPMCRKTIYFKGLYKKKKLWEEEKHYKKCSEAYMNVINDLLAMAKTCAFTRLYFKQILEDVEEDYNKFRDIIYDYDDLEYLLVNPDALIIDDNRVPMYFTKTTHRQACNRNVTHIPLYNTKATHRHACNRNKKNKYCR